MEDVRVDDLGLPHDTTPAAVIAKKKNIYKFNPLEAVKTFNGRYACCSHSRSVDDPDQDNFQKH